jgi:hypothetical protein
MYVLTLRLGQHKHMSRNLHLIPQLPHDHMFVHSGQGHKVRRSHSLGHPILTLEYLRQLCKFYPLAPFLIRSDVAADIGSNIYVLEPASKGIGTRLQKLKFLISIYTPSSVWVGIGGGDGGGD